MGIEIVEKQKEISSQAANVIYFINFANSLFLVLLYLTKFNLSSKFLRLFSPFEF